VTEAGIIGISSCTQRVVLPAVRDMARELFGCDELAGPELENQDSGCRLVGSHWEQRMFNGNTMAPTSSSHQVLSPLTLAMAEESGWYKANFSALEQQQWPGRDWGSDVGCDAALHKPGLSGDPLRSVTTNSSLRAGEPLFCSESSSSNECSFDRRGVGICQLVSYQDLEEEYRHFGETEAPYQAGTLQRMEFLPHVPPSRWCEDTTEHKKFNLDSETGLFFGNESACFDSTLVLDDTRFVSVDRVSGCYRHRCIWPAQTMTSIGSNGLADPILQIIPFDREGDPMAGVNCTASDAGIGKSVGGFTGSIKCIHPKLLCRVIDDPRETLSSAPSIAPSPETSPT